MDESIRVLHVDDDPSVTDLTASFLERTESDLEVVTATSAAEGLEVLDRERIDCVVSDYQMPATDGFEFLETVRDRDPDLPFILFTGKGSEEIASEAISAGVTDYLQKETGRTQYELLANRIVNAVSQYRLERDRLSQSPQYQCILEDILGMYLVTRRGDERIIEDCNERFADRLGYDRTDLVGEPVSALVTEDGDAICHRVSETSGADGEWGEQSLETADGGTVPMRFRTCPWLDPDEETVGTLAMFVEDTERLERERELERQNRRLDEFASVVSHDLRNPINVVEGRVELAKQDCECDGVGTHLAKAQSELERMDALIDDVLSYARHGQEITETEPVDLGAVTEAAWTAVGSDEGAIEVTEDLTVRANRIRLQRLVENLVRNAVEHVGEDVTVRVDAIEDGFCIEDDGPGVPEDRRREVFDPGVTTAEDGTGFGLAIVKTIAESHGWTVDLIEGADGGARFAFTDVDMLDRPEDPSRSEAAETSPDAT